MDSPGEELEVEVEPPTFSSGSAFVASFNKSFGGTAMSVVIGADATMLASSLAGAQMESTRGCGHGNELERNTRATRTSIRSSRKIFNLTGASRSFQIQVSVKCWNTVSRNIIMKPFPGWCTARLDKHGANSRICSGIQFYVVVPFLHDMSWHCCSEIMPYLTVHVPIIVHEVIYHFLNLFPRRSPQLNFRSKFWHDNVRSIFSYPPNRQFFTNNDGHFYFRNVVLNIPVGYAYHKRRQKFTKSLFQRQCRCTMALRQTLQTSSSFSLSSFY